MSFKAVLIGGDRHLDELEVDWVLDFIDCEKLKPHGPLPSRGEDRAKPIVVEFSRYEFQSDTTNGVLIYEHVH